MTIVQHEMDKLKRQNWLHGLLVALCVLTCMGTFTIYALMDDRSEFLPQKHYFSLKNTDTQRVAREDAVIALLPLGSDLSVAFLDRHRQLLETRFGAQVVLLEAQALPDSAYNTSREQYRAKALLSWLFLHKPSEATHILAVTTADLYEDNWAFLYGYSQSEGRVAVYSMARLLVDDPLDAERRLEKIVYHEVGHAFGLSHCDERCVMHVAASTRAIDKLPSSYCHRCASALSRTRSEDLVEVVETPVAQMVERGDGLYRRGSVARAQVIYALALMQRPTDPELLNRVGVTSMQIGQPRLADLAFRTSLELRPDDPKPFYNLGLLYARVDAKMGLRLLEAGLALDPDRVEAHGILGRVHLEVFRDEHRALWYFERYVAGGGSEPSVLARYRALSSGEVVFEEGMSIRSGLGGASWAFRWGILRMQLLVVLEELQTPSSHARQQAPVLH